MRLFNRHYFRSQRLLTIRQAADADLLALHTETLTWQLYRTYLSLLDELCQQYRIGATVTGERWQEDAFLSALRTFNADMYELSVINEARTRADHWLYQLLVQWRTLWDADHQDTHKASNAIISRTPAEPGDWQQDALHGLKAWADAFREHSQTY